MNDNTPLTISNLASFAKLERFLTARRESFSSESEMNFEEFEVSLSQITHEIENEIKAHELARYDVRAPEIFVEGKVFRKCLEDEKKRYMTASGPIFVERNLYRPQGGGESICPLELRAGKARRGGEKEPVKAV